jgi:hypothetical protein
MTVIRRWWCCAEYGRTGTQHADDCEYALLGDRAPALVQVKADYARLAHQHAGAVEAFERIGKLAAWIERDRREPDKVLAYAQELACLSTPSRGVVTP